jgi:hypothetical protein
MRGKKFDETEEKEKVSDRDQKSHLDFAQIMSQGTSGLIITKSEMASQTQAQVQKGVLSELTIVGDRNGSPNQGEGDQNGSPKQVHIAELPTDFSPRDQARTGSQTDFSPGNQERAGSQTDVSPGNQARKGSVSDATNSANPFRGKQGKRKKRRIDAAESILTELLESEMEQVSEDKMGRLLEKAANGDVVEGDPDSMIITKLRERLISTGKIIVDTDSANDDDEPKGLTSESVLVGSANKSNAAAYSTNTTAPLPSSK